MRRPRADRGQKRDPMPGARSNKRLTPKSRLQKMHSYFRLRHSRSMNTLSIHRRRPSIEMRTPAACSTPVNRGEVNWLPWSVLKITGRSNRASASSTALMQNSTSMVFDTRQASTFRVAQSITATR